MGVEGEDGQCEDPARRRSSWPSVRPIKGASRSFSRTPMSEPFEIVASGLVEASGPRGFNGGNSASVDKATLGALSEAERHVVDWRGCSRIVHDAT